MLFHIQCMDKPDCLETRITHREAHLAYLDTLGDRLFAAGPLLNAHNDMIGSVLIIEFESDDLARHFCESDPYATAGLFDSVDIMRWRKTLPR